MGRLVMAAAPRSPDPSLVVSLAILVAAGLTCACGSQATGETRAEAPARTASGFETEIAQVRARQKWHRREEFLHLRLEREILEQSLDLGTRFLVKYQTERGDFRYQYDWLQQTWRSGENQVRQAGALWGLSLCHRHEPSTRTRAALKKGFDFWFDQTFPVADGALAVRYLMADSVKIGTVALVGLAIIEYLQGADEIDSEFRRRLELHLDGYLAFLQSMQLPDGHFSGEYHFLAQTRSSESSPYYDGETLLCLTKAARYLGYSELIPVVERAARAMAETYTVRSWEVDPDSKQTKGFFQWGSMAFLEYYEAQWKDHELIGDVALALSWWMVHTHETMARSLNTAYAVEGLIAGYRVASQRGDSAAAVDLLYVIDRMLFKLTSWQINGPLASHNEFLVNHPTQDEWAVGGVMNKDSPARRPRPATTYHELRVDVTQHQMHAVSLALHHIYL